VLAIFAYSDNSHADNQARSTATWQLSGKSITMVFTINIADSKAMLGRKNSLLGEQALINFLSKNISLIIIQNDCLVADKKSLPSTSDFQRIRFTHHCTENITQFQLDLQNFFKSTPQHIHFIKFKIDDKLIANKMITQRTPDFSWSTIDGAVNETSEDGHIIGSSVFVSYLLLGYEHILIGMDHLAFLLAMFIIISKPKPVLLLITGFTIGHSITLSLMTFKIMQPNILWVEALIGFSIALIAIENIIMLGSKTNRIIWAGLLLLFSLAILKHEQTALVIALLGLMLFFGCYLRLVTLNSSLKSNENSFYWRGLVTLLFGMIHGFGFASVLTQIGLPEADIITGLIAFNVGVELGQLSFVALSSFFLYVIFKFTPLNRKLSLQIISSMLSGIGIYWFVTRTMVIF
jgi:hypothetical protein